MVVISARQQLLHKSMEAPSLINLPYIVYKMYKSYLQLPHQVTGTLSEL